MRDAFERLFQQVWSLGALSMCVVHCGKCSDHPINWFRNQNYLASHRTDILYCSVIEQSICGPRLETQNCPDRLCSSLMIISCLQACFNIFPGTHDRVFQWPFRGDATRDRLDTEGKRDDWEELVRTDYSHQALHYNQFRRIEYLGIPLRLITRWILDLKISSARNRLAGFPSHGLL